MGKSVEFFRRLVAVSMAALRATWSRVISADRWLLAALATGVLLGVTGLGWGRYECLNLDRLAFQNVFAENRRPFEPDRFVKPPLYTYLHLFLSRWPTEFVVRQVPGLKKMERRAVLREARVVVARVWNLVMFAGLVLLVFRICDQGFGRSAARVAAWMTASSAGFVPYKIFLTTDLALLFFMTAAFAAAVGIVRDPGWKISILAGLLAGLAGAVKYNGLAIAVCLPLAHLLASRGNPIIACLRRPSAWLCGLAVPVGFILGNPYSVLDFPKFWEGFHYNYTVTPIYAGAGGGPGYMEFLGRFPEIFGWPGSVLLFGSMAAGLFLTFPSSDRELSFSTKIWLLAAAAFAIYFWKIGGFPRVETRFVLPLAPFALILASPGLGKLADWKPTLILILLPIAAYNAVCGSLTASLFRNDPRMAALSWADDNIRGEAVIEASRSCPQWQFLPGAKVTIHSIPSALERKEAFTALFADDPEMLQRVGRFEAKTDVGWFAADARAARNPRWITWCTVDLDGVSRPHFDALFRPDSGARVIFDRTSPPAPPWLYPRATEFLRNRMVIWEVEAVK